MRYVTSAERSGIEKGFKRGLEQGRNEGRDEGLGQGLEQGRRAGEARFLVRQLQARFGPLPAWVTAQVDAASTDLLERWGERILEARRLDEVFEDPA